MPQRREDSRSAAAQAAPSIQEDDPIMLPFINVYDLGAVGNGRADDTEAFKKALSIAENADFGILRGIVSEPDKAYAALKDKHFAVNITDVIGISCPNVPGALAKILRLLSDEGVFIEYMYSFANGDIANIVIRPNNINDCIRILTTAKVDLLAANDLYKL